MFSSNSKKTLTPGSSIVTITQPKIWENIYYQNIQLIFENSDLYVILTDLLLSQLILPNRTEICMFKYFCTNQLFGKITWNYLAMSADTIYYHIIYTIYPSNNYYKINSVFKKKNNTEINLHVSQLKQLICIDINYFI